MRFAANDTVHSIPSRYDLTAGDRQRLFYTIMDKKRMDSEKTQTLSLMKEGIYPDNETMCFRGLEVELREVMEHRKYVITAVKAAVLREGKRSKGLSSRLRELEKVRCRLVVQSQEAARYAAVWDTKNCFNCI